MHSRELLYIVIGYLSGSILFARIFGQLFHNRDITAEGTDRNPGTVNAFRYGGFWCGLLTLCGDLLKGFFPVHLYLSRIAPGSFEFALSLIMAAPVLGHILPIFYRFRGGKGIAVSFGCLLGILPQAGPVLTLACLFLFFSLIIRITPDYHRTLITYGLAALTVILCRYDPAITTGFFLIAGMIIVKLLSSAEEREPFHLEVLWKH